MKTIVVSAVNIRKGGTLTILRNCLEYLSGLAQSGNYRVVALVHKKDLACYPGIEYIELPWTIKNWVLRLWCEYVTMYGISKQLSPVYLWLSLHDTTPNVKAERRAVYCHNPFSFYPWKWKDLFLNYHIVCFAWFTKYIYKINLHKNFRILVQQQWLRENFIRMFHLPRQKVVVTLPAKVNPVPQTMKVAPGTSVYTFLYPSYGDIHKNFELLCRAAASLENEMGIGKFRVIHTPECCIKGGVKHPRWSLRGLWTNNACMIHTQGRIAWCFRQRWRRGDCPSVSMPSRANRCCWPICHIPMKLQQAASRRLFSP